MKPFAFEESFIKTLTSIAWWFDYKYDKTVVWLAFAFTTFVPYIVVLLMGIDSYNRTILQMNSFETWVIIFVLIVPISVSILMLFAVGLFMFLFTLDPSYTNTRELFQNTKKSPNPNKYTYWIMMCRYSFIIPIMSYVCHGFKGETLLMAMFTIIVITPPMYLLCVDPLPPAKKKEMREAKVMENLKPVTTI